MNNIIIFGYGSSYNTNTQFYIDRVSDLYKKVEKFAGDYSDKYYNNSIPDLQKDKEKKEMEKKDDNNRYSDLVSKLQKKIENYIGDERCYVPGLVIHGISIGLKFDTSILEKCRNILLDELICLKENNYVMISNTQIKWLSSEERAKFIANELKLLGN